MPNWAEFGFWSGAIQARLIEIEQQRREDQRRAALQSAADDQDTQQQQQNQASGEEYMSMDQAYLTLLINLEAGDSEFESEDSGENIDQTALSLARQQISDQAYLALLRHLGFNDVNLNVHDTAETLDPASANADHSSPDAVVANQLFLELPFAFVHPIPFVNIDAREFLSTVRYEVWLAHETEDMVQQELTGELLAALQPKTISLFYPSISVTSFAPRIRVPLVITTIGISHPSNIPYRHNEAVLGPYRPDPEDVLFRLFFVTMASSPRHIIWVPDPLHLYVCGGDRTALTPASNPGHLPRSERLDFYFCTDNENNLFPEFNGAPRTSYESMDVHSGGSLHSSCDETEYHALLEFIADPAASLQRRLKEKLAGLSKKQRSKIAEEYLERQREELELDALRELNGTNCRGDIDSVWEIDEPCCDETTTKLSAEAAEFVPANLRPAEPDTPEPYDPATTYGYVPLRAQVPEPELWAEMLRCILRLSLQERHQMLDALVHYAFALSLHCAWYAGLEAHLHDVRTGKAVWDPATPAFPPHPAFPADPHGALDAKPYVRLALLVMPWGNCFASDAHLATMAIATVRALVKLDVEESGRHAAVVRDWPVPIGETELRRVAAQFERELEFFERSFDLLKQAHERFAAALSKACKAGVFDVDDDELTEEEGEVEEEEEEDKGERAEKPKKKKGGKKKAKKGKKGKGKARAEVKEDVEKEEEEEEEREEKEEEEKEAAPGAVVPAAAPAEEDAGLVVGPTPAATTPTDALLASLAEQDAEAEARREEDPVDWAAHFEDGDVSLRTEVCPCTSRVPHNRWRVTGREGWVRRV